VEFRHRGKVRRLETGMLLVHHGIVPRTHLTRAAGCDHRWDDSQQCWRPVVDGWGNSSVEGIAVAGDGAAIGGAVAASHAGRLAAFEALRALGRVDGQARDRLAQADRRWLQADLRIRPFLEALFRLPEVLLGRPPNETIVCRCEEVTAGQIREAVADGHGSTNQVKFLTRCGMGLCQGRQCNDAVAHIVAAERGQPVAEVGAYRVRPPVRPLILGALADLDGVEDVTE
jgi:bacterioferritin-associated ferredoxin